MLFIQLGLALMEKTVCIERPNVFHAVKKSEETPVPVVSVIVIFFNPGRFLSEAVESVISQTFLDWELLLVDDGSNDGSSEIAKAYASQDSRRVHYLCHPAKQNRGRSASRNLGLARARGELVAFLDADDVWVRHKLIEQAGLFEANPEVDMICGATIEWKSWANPTFREKADRLYFPGEIRPESEAPLALPINEVIDPPGALLALMPLGQGRSPSMSNLVVRRRLLDRIGGFDDRFCGILDDQIYLTKIFMSGRIFIANKKWDYYRQHPGSCMASTKFTERMQAWEEFLRWLDDYMAEARGANIGGFELVEQKLEASWNRWQSNSLKRRIVTIMDKILPVPVMIKIYRIFDKMRHYISFLK